MAHVFTLMASEKKSLYLMFIFCDTGIVSHSTYYIVVEFIGLFNFRLIRYRAHLAGGKNLTVQLSN